MVNRRETRTIKIGKVKIGAAHPVAIQSMTKTDTKDVDATLSQIRALEKSGCEIVRVAVKDMAAAKTIGSVKQGSNIPLVADIHFDHTLAIEAIEQGADKIRINPGNITDHGAIESLIDCAREKKVPIRIGVNSGSLKGTQKRGGMAGLMVGAVMKYLEPFNRMGFHDIVISLKSSDVRTTVEAYGKMAKECDYPFHVGITAAGTASHSIVRSSAGIGALLLAGIGDTVRVSLTGDPVREVEIAKQILASVGAREFGADIISCPTCGRCQVDLVPIVEELEKKIKGIGAAPGGTHKPLVIALMGCEVNGPGEARAADIGVAFGKGRGVIFRNGEIVKTVDADHAVDELLKLIEG